MDDEERTEGMRCIAAPIFNEFREAVAGVSISGPTGADGAARGAELGARVRAAADRITRAIGGALAGLDGGQSAASRSTVGLRPEPRRCSRQLELRGRSVAGVGDALRQASAGIRHAVAGRGTTARLRPPTSTDVRSPRRIT